MDGPSFCRDPGLPGRQVIACRAPDLQERKQAKAKSTVFENIDEVAASLEADRHPFLLMRDGHKTKKYSLCVKNNIYINADLWTKILLRRGIPAIIDELEYCLCLKLEKIVSKEIDDEDDTVLNESIFLACNTLAEVNALHYFDSKCMPLRRDGVPAEQEIHRCIHYLVAVIFHNLHMFGESALPVASASLAALSNLVDTYDFWYILVGYEWLNPVAMSVGYMRKSNGEEFLDPSQNVQMSLVAGEGQSEDYQEQTLGYQIATHWSNELAARICDFMSAIAQHDDTRKSISFPRDASDLIFFCLRYCSQCLTVQVCGIRALGDVLCDLRRTFFKKYFEEYSNKIMGETTEDTATALSESLISGDSHNVPHEVMESEQTKFEWENRRVNIILLLREAKERHGGKSGFSDLDQWMKRLYGIIGPDPKEDLYIMQGSEG